MSGAVATPSSSNTFSSQAKNGGSEKYSAHHHEQQVILMEKFEVCVLGTQEKLITYRADLDEALQAFIGHKLSIIYLFSAG